MRVKSENGSHRLTVSIFTCLTKRQFLSCVMGSIVRQSSKCESLQQLGT